jgi:hypothetical protein
VVPDFGKVFLPVRAGPDAQLLEHHVVLGQRPRQRACL